MMKKLIVLLSSVLLSLCMVTCSNDTTTLNSQLTTLETEHTTTALVDKYEEFELKYGIYPLFESALIPVQTQDELWGYINNEGEMIIDATFDWASSFYENGYANVYIDSGYNIIDMAGNIILGESYPCIITMYSNYLLCSRTWSGLPTLYDVYDYEGNILMESITDIDLIYEQYPKEYQGSWKIDQNSEGKLALITPEGEPITEYIYDDMWFLSRQNYICVRIGDYFGILDSTGTVILEPIYLNRMGFGNDLMDSDIAPIVTEEGLLGFVDIFGDIIIEPQFDVSIYYEYDYRTLPKMWFYDGVQLVDDGDTQYIIDLEGTILFELPEGAIGITGYDDEIISYIYYVDDDYLSKVIDYEGNLLYQGTNQVISLTQDNSDVFFAVEGTFFPQPGILGTDATMYNYQAEVLKENFSFVYDNSISNNYLHRNFINGYMDFIDNATETIGFMDTTGTTVIQPQFEVDGLAYSHLSALMFHSDGYAVVMKDGLYGIIDKDGNVVADYLYLSINTNLFY